MWLSKDRRREDGRWCVEVEVGTGTKGMTLKDVRNRVVKKVEKEGEGREEGKRNSEPIFSSHFPVQACPFRAPPFQKIIAVLYRSLQPPSHASWRENEDLLVVLLQYKKRSSFSSVRNYFFRPNFVSK